MPLLDELADYIVAANIARQGGTTGNLFQGSASTIPTGDGPYMSLIEYGGIEGAGTQNNTGTERPSAQIMARGKSAVATRAMVKQAWLLFGGVEGIHNVTLGSTGYVKIKPKQSVTDLQQEPGTGRAMYGFNIDAEKQPS